MNHSFEPCYHVTKSTFVDVVMHDTYTSTVHLKRRSHTYAYHILSTNPNISLL